MRKLFPLASVSLAVLFGAALLVALTGTTAGEDGRKPKSDIAVIHMDGVLTAYKKYLKGNDEITAYEQKLSVEIEGKNKTLESLKHKRDAYAKGSREWWDYDKQFKNTAVELDNYTRKAQAEINKLDNDLFITILNDIEGAIKEYCGKHSIRMVLWKKEVVLDQPTAALNTIKLNQISVLYVDEELDITEEITEMLNAGFEEENKE